MAGFFSLGRGGTSRLASNTAQQEGDGGGAGGRDNSNSHNLASQANTGINPETSWFLYRNEEITYRGSELWQQQQTMQLQQQRINHPADLYASEVGLGVGPGGGGSSSRNNSDHDQSNTGGGVRSGGYLMTRGIETGVGSVGSCQDCGNQAKKDCVHVRCRTCCKSRGFQCATHVRSTWVPAARRRERLQQQQKHYTEAASLDHLSKRHRESDRHHHASSSTRLPSATLSAGTNTLDLHNLPSELSSEALFRCVKVSPIDDEDNSRNEQQFAYQTAVKIGGHIFKGILYDQGPETSSYRSGGDTSSGTGGAPPQPPPLDRISAAPTTSATPSSSAGPMASSPVVFLDPSFYPAPPPSFMAGTQFLPYPRP